MDDSIGQPRRGQKPEPLRKIDEGLHPIMLKLKEIADYLPDTLKARKSQLDDINFMESQEIVREYMKKLPPPESVLDADDLIVVHNLRLSLEGSYKLMRSRWEGLWEELDMNLRKRGPQKPRPKRPARRVHVPTEEEAAAEPPLSSLDTPDVEQLFNDRLLNADPSAITLEDNVPMRPAAPAELFGMGFNDEAIPDVARPMPMDVDGMPVVRPQEDVEICPEMMEVIPVEELPASTPHFVESVPSVPIAEVPCPPEQILVDPVLPEVVFQEPSGPSTAGTGKPTSRTQRLSLGQLLDRLEAVPDEAPPKRQRKHKNVPNKCRKRGTQLTRKEVHKVMESLNYSYQYLTRTVVLGPRPETDDNSPCTYPNRNIRKWAKYMPEFFEEEIADRNTFTSVADGIIRKLKALGGVTPLRQGSVQRAVRSSGVGIQTPLAVPDLSGERISAPSTGGLQPGSPHVPSAQNVLQAEPEVEPPPRDELAEKLQPRRPPAPQRSLAPLVDPQTPLRAFPEEVSGSRSDAQVLPARADLAMDVGTVGFAPDPEEFHLMDVGVPVGQTDGHGEQIAPGMGPQLELSPEEAARRAKEERRTDRQIRRVGDCESTDESTVTLSTSYLMLEEELVARLKNLWAADGSRVVTFAELCPPAAASREKAARTFEILINLAGSSELIITQTSPQPQHVMITQSATPLRVPSRVSPQGSSHMSFTLVRSSSASSMSLTLDSSTAVSAKPSESPSDSG